MYIEGGRAVTEVRVLLCTGEGPGGQDDVT